MMTLILFLFSQLAHSEEQCVINDPGGLVKFAHALAKPSYSIYNKLFDDSNDSNNEDDFENSSEEDNDESNDSMKNLIGPIIFGVFFIFFAVVLIFWTLCAQIFAFCKCCIPVKSGKPSVCIIILFSIASALIFFSIIVLYVSASKFTKSFNDVVTLTKNFNTTYDNLIYKITNPIYITIQTLDNGTNQIKQTMSDLANLIDTSSQAQVDNAQRSKDIINDFVNSFHLTADSTKNGEYKTIHDTYTDPPKLDDIIQNVIIKTSPPLIGIADKMINSNNDFKITSNKLHENLNGNTFNDINNQIQDGYNGVDDATGSFNEISTIISNLTDITDMISNNDKIFNFAVYSIPTFVLIFLVLYIISFIIKCCCSRCLLAWFHCFGFFVTLFVVLVGAIFAILFGVFDKNCPNFIEFLIDDFGFLGDVEISRENKTNMFVCEETKPLMDLGLDQIIELNDIKESLKDVPNKLNNLVDFTQIHNLHSNLNNFDEGNDLTKMITAEYIITQYDKKLPNLDPDNGKIDQIIQLIQRKDDDLPEANSKMEKATHFADETYPLIDQTLTQTSEFASYTDNIDYHIKENLRETTCIETRCVYTTIRNPFCNNLLSATAHWAIAAMATIIGLMLMSIAICKRRRQFKVVVTSPNDEFDSGNQDLAGFNANDELL